MFQRHRSDLEDAAYDKSARGCLRILFVLFVKVPACLALAAFTIAALFPAFGDRPILEECESCSVECRILTALGVVSLCIVGIAAANLLIKFIDKKTMKRK